MAEGVTVEVRGLAELAAGTRTLARNIDRGAGQEFGRVANQLADQVRGGVPRDTGLLASSVAGQPIAAGGRVEMGAGVPYARFVEFGGRGFPRSSEGNYVGPAVKTAGSQLADAGGQAAKSEIGRMRWPTP